MKKLITIVFAIILVSSLSAQTEQESFLLALSNLNFTSLSLTDLDGVDESDLPEMTSSASEFSLMEGILL